MRDGRGEEVSGSKGTASSENLAPRGGSHSVAVLRSICRVFIYLVAVWAIWELLILVFALPAYLVPPPSEVIKSLAELPTYYLRHAVVTMEEAGFGALIGFASGFALGVCLRYGGTFARAVNPVIVASQVFPKEALAPLLLVFLGFGILPKIVISALICFFPVVVNTAKGMYATPSAYEQLTHVIGATEWERFWHCRLPFAAPYILASLRVCATLSVVGAVVGEFVGSSAGLGHVVRAASADMGTERVYAALLLLGLEGAAFYGAALLVEQRIFARYSQVS